MAKSHSLTDAIRAAINMESIKVDVGLNPEQKQLAVNEQLAIVADSNFDTLGAMGDELIELREQAEEILGAAGIDPKQFRADNALAGVRAAAAMAEPIEQVEAEQDEPEQVEAEQVEPIEAEQDAE
jgi:hypothetical protein